MVEVEMATYHSFRLGHKILRDISVSWPKPRSFKSGAPLRRKIAYQPCRPSTPVITPNLDALSIVIDASIVDYTLHMPITGVRNTTIPVLQLGDSVIHTLQSPPSCRMCSLMCWRSIDGTKLYGTPYCLHQKRRSTELGGKWLHA